MVMEAQSKGRLVEGGWTSRHVLQHFHLSWPSYGHTVRHADHPATRRAADAWPWNVTRRLGPVYSAVVALAQIWSRRVVIEKTGWFGAMATRSSSEASVPTPWKNWPTSQCQRVR